MARFRPAVDVWQLSQKERQRLQIGQWVYAGDTSNKGRWYGSNGRVDVVAWLGNARAWRKRAGGIRGYFASIRDYGRGLTRR